ncbi:Signal transduction histidine kinase [Arthrobacter subterraneus]|uniref:histidine kinase n=2 Tax=Arthrobacter TaxID=1663 RepID=A0A1G8PA08_9MICC|nr:HAMP domain-containing sensor histidine kinase [Arthrobacter subterraneus]SDI89353.1 Signal transduction histidine kinase [Arthrobacter subterraneus]
MNAKTYPPAGGDGRRRATWGVRKQATAAAVLTLAVVLAVAGIILLVLLRSSLLDNARELAIQHRDSVLEQVAEDDSADVTGDVTGTNTQITQILRADGTMLASSDDSITESLYEGGPLRPGQKYVSPDPGLFTLTDFDDHVVAAGGVATPDGEFTVVAGVPTSIQRDAVTTVGWFLLGGVPVLLALAGGLIWVLVGRSLRPVERIRATVAGITRQHLDERVEVPATRDEIEHLAATMNEMLGRLESADQAQRRFVTNASHELRSPLATLTTALEIAAADPTARTWWDTSGMLQLQTRRMSYLVEDLLTLAKLDDAGLRFTMTDVDLDDVLGEEIHRLRSVSTHTVNALLAPARVTGDPHRLAQVFRNVLNNAARHASTRVDIHVTTINRAAVITVDNDGDTIPADQREKIFDRFVRLDASRTRESGGSGLGLAISREILHMHRGAIHATETPEGHTRFRITVPLQDTADTRHALLLDAENKPSSDDAT